MGDIPYATRGNRTRVIWMIERHPPPTPACFDSRQQWQDYLLYVDASGQQILRRVDKGKKPHRTLDNEFLPIPICEDCQIGGRRQQRMAQEGRCIPPAMSPPDRP